MLVNACFWTTGLEAVIKPDLEISLVGPFNPTWLGTFRRAGNAKPSDLASYDSPIFSAVANKPKAK
jgi:hypothetical protein